MSTKAVKKKKAVEPEGDVRVENREQMEEIAVVPQVGQTRFHPEWSTARVLEGINAELAGWLASGASPGGATGVELNIVPEIQRRLADLIAVYS